MAAIPRSINTYSFTSARTSTPKAGLAVYDPIPDSTASYSLDPHDSPSLLWAGKSPASSLSVPTLSIHQHELIHPARILAPVLQDTSKAPNYQFTLFSDLDPLAKLREIGRAIEAYSHTENWTNRMIAGDSLVVMNSLIQKEHMAGTVQTCYIDPPYGIKYGSNFQPFVGKKDVKDKSDDDLTTEPEMIRAFRDTWELGVHSYLTYLRNRLYLVRELLKDEGSVFVQISDENVHHVRELLDEVFGPENFVTMIKFRKAGNRQANMIASANDYLVWYAKDKERAKYHQLLIERKPGTAAFDMYDYVDCDDGTVRKLTREETLDKKFLSCHRNFRYTPLYSDGTRRNSTEFIEFKGEKFLPPRGRHWKVSMEGIKRLIAAGRIDKSGNTLRYKQYMDDSPLMLLDDYWDDTGGTPDMRYVVQTSTKVIQRCILMTSDPADLVLDITCGSGTTAYVAEQWGRRWITCDTSRVALAIARQRLLTATFPYYQLADPDAGISSGFAYKSVPHITLKSIANNEPPAREILYDQPEIDRSRIRVSGPFSMESLPAPVVFSPDEAADSENIIQNVNQSSRLSGWMEQLKATGIVARNGERVRFSSVEQLTGTRWLNAKAYTDEETPKTALVCFADESTLMDSKHISGAFGEAVGVRPDYMIFAAFQFDPEGAELIREYLNIHGITTLQVQMNPDLMTDDLRKKLRTDQSFWLVWQPDAELVRTDAGKFRVRVLGFDYYNVSRNKVESGDADKIAMWFLDPDYNGMTFRALQGFFPMEGKKGGWSKLAKTLGAEIDPDLIEAYAGTESLEFSAGEKVAVKIIDDRGIESMTILKREEAE